MTLKTNDVYFETLPAQKGAIGLIYLNRPKVFNALNHPMINSIHSHLLTWEQNENISAVIICSTSDSNFCAGGDIRLIYNNGLERHQQSFEFFRDEYQLNLTIKQYKKPYIALLKGIAMGGGLGISVNGSHVIAAENLKLAMPETRIGFYPDVGASYFLSRCPNHLGFYLGLSGNTIGVSDAMLCKLVNSYVPSKSFADLIPAIAQVNLNSSTAITELCEKFTAKPPETTLHDKIDLIDNCFAKESVEDIIQALQKDPDAWAQEQAKTLLLRSPTSLKVTLKQLTKATSLNFSDCMNMEHTITKQFLQHHDFYEGIRAAIIDKTGLPQWSPNELNSVSNANIDMFF